MCLVVEQPAGPAGAIALIKLLLLLLTRTTPALGKRRSRKLCAAAAGRYHH